MKFRPFQREDFATYLSWYENENLNDKLGPMDHEWLEYVMGQPQPVEFAMFEDRKLVAVIGIDYPQEGQRTWFITDIAVDPTQARMGFGKKILHRLLEYFAATEQPPLKWIAWVDEENRPARQFFQSLGWVESENANPENMFQFSLDVHK